MLDRNYCSMSLTRIELYIFTISDLYFVTCLNVCVSFKPLLIL